jgi:hypothetical protein
VEILLRHGHLDHNCFSPFSIDCPNLHTFDPKAIKSTEHYLKALSIRFGHLVATEESGVSSEVWDGL